MWGWEPQEKAEEGRTQRGAPQKSALQWGRTTESNSQGQKDSSKAPHCPQPGSPEVSGALTSKWGHFGKLRLCQWVVSKRFFWGTIILFKYAVGHNTESPGTSICKVFLAESLRSTKSGALTGQAYLLFLIVPRLFPFMRLMNWTFFHFHLYLNLIWNLFCFQCKLWFLTDFK